MKFRLHHISVGEVQASLSVFTAAPCLCFLLTSGVSVPPGPSSVGGQSLHGSHDSGAHPAVPPGHRQWPPWQPAALCPHLGSQSHLGVSRPGYCVNCGLIQRAQTSLSQSQNLHFTWLDTTDIKSQREALWDVFYTLNQVYKIQTAQ